MNIDNTIIKTDSYKLTHANQYPEGTRKVYSYLEPRVGAAFQDIVVFGLQPLLRILSKPVTMDDVREAAALSAAHFGTDSVFNLEGWTYIATELSGRLPVRIKALPEGTIVSPGTAVMTIENTDDKCWWLTNALESFLMHQWYPSTVSTLSRAVKKMQLGYLEKTSDNLDGLPFMLHDFGYRGATGDEAAARGGLGHLVNYLGTDTLPAILLAVNEYEADLTEVGFSVVATEHSVMTALGAAGERAQVQRLLDNNPTGIVSCVGDSYNIYKFTEQLGAHFKPQILARDGKFVLRPDSITPGIDDTPEDLVISLLNIVGRDFGYTINSKGFKVLNPKIGLIWGDGIDYVGIEKILSTMMINGWSAENIVFGMGGGLLQKVNRDTLRWALKAAAIFRNGTWTPVQKNPLDTSKKSKAGRLKNILDATDSIITVREDEFPDKEDLMCTVFEAGWRIVAHRLSDIRDRAAL